MLKIEKNQKVTLAYSLKNTAGDILEKVDQEDAIQYIHGYQLIFPKLEEALDGLLEGTHLSLSLTSDDAFGRYESSQVTIVDRHELENIPHLEVGMEIAVLNEDPQFEKRQEKRDHFWTPQEPSDLFNDDSEEEEEGEGEEQGDKDSTLLDEIFIVKEIHELFVVLDSNHPFAGMDVTFEVDILKVEPASFEEIEDIYNDISDGTDLI